MNKILGQYADRRFVVITDEDKTEKIINSKTQVEFLELVNALNAGGFNYVPYPANDADIIVLYRGQIRELYIDYGQSPRLAAYDGEQEVRKVLVKG